MQATSSLKRSWISDARIYWHDCLAVAKYSIIMFSRYRSWFLNLAIGPFMMIAPFVFLGDTLVGEGNRLSGSYFEETGYAGYVGFLVVPLIAVNLSNTVFSWIGGLIRQEQRSGTLERILVTSQFASTLFVGRALAHMVYVALFAIATLVLVFIWVRPDFDVNVGAAVFIICLHFLALYGMAFAMSSALLRIADSWTVQTVLTRALLSIIAGATFPITLFPGWLQAIAKVFPFTWVFEMERRSLLRGEGFEDLMGGLVYVVAITVVFWLAGFWFLNRELSKAKSEGSLGTF